MGIFKSYIHNDITMYIRQIQNESIKILINFSVSTLNEWTKLNYLLNIKYDSVQILFGTREIHS